MESHRPYIFKDVNGFTFAEIILTIGLLAALLAVVVPVGIGYLHTYNLVTQQDTLAGLLLSARSRALAHTGQGSYSVYLDDTKYVLFQGEVYNESSLTNEVTQLAGVVSHTPASAVVSFLPLSGRSSNQTIIMQNNGHSVSLQVNAEGAIE